MPKSLKIVFAGTPDYAAHNFKALLSTHHQIIAAYTQPDRPSGRGKKITESAVKKIALEHNIPVLQPENFKTENSIQELVDLKADIMIVVAYGIILPQAVLDIPPLGCINVHASLLPKWRGAAPIERSLMAGDQQTGVTIMQMDKGLDTGDMLKKSVCAITPTMTSSDLYEALVPIGSDALIKTLEEIAGNNSSAEKQDESQACYAKKIFKPEGKIDWEQPAAAISCHIRGLSPRPVAFTYLDNQVIRVWNAFENPASNIHSSQPGVITAVNKDHIEVACTNNSSILITQLQLSGGKNLPVSDIVNSKKDLFAVGKQFMSEEI